MKQNYSDKLKNPKWQKKRLEIMSRDEFTCQTCGDKESTLNVHHIEYSESNPWDEPEQNLVTVCEFCHSRIEEIKKNIRIKDFSSFKVARLFYEGQPNSFFIISFDGSFNMFSINVPGRENMGIGFGNITTTFVRDQINEHLKRTEL